MLFMNDWDIEMALDRFAGNPATPNLGRAAVIVANLAEWTNGHSDGWAYWPKPCRAAKGLQELLTRANPTYPTDVTAEAVQRATRPVKAFLTRQGVPHDEILP